MDKDDLEYYRHENFQRAREALKHLTNRKTEIVRGVSRLLDVREIQVIFFLHRRTTYRFIRRWFKPMGGVVSLGKRLYVHAWAVQRLINMVGRCPECGRPWQGEDV